jgi:hypothetical protein
MLYQVVRATSLNVRSYPIISPDNVVGQLSLGQWVFVYQTLGNFACLNRAGHRWVSLAYLQPAPSPLVGVHGPSGHSVQQADLDLMKTARIEAVKIISSDDWSTLAPYQQLGHPLLVARVFIYANRPLDSSQYLIDALDIVRHLYTLGIRFFELYNEVNLKDEGWTWNWKDGREFLFHYLRVLKSLQAGFPDCYFSYPAMSPNGLAIPDRTSEARFFYQSVMGAIQADWIAIHSYWQTDAELEREIQRVNSFPNFGLPLLVTECGNPLPGAHRGPQYVRFYAKCVNAKAIFPFLISSTGSPENFPQWVWRHANGKTEADIITALAHRPA